MADLPQLRPAQICPVCKKPNECGVAEGKGTCWCFTEKVSQDLEADDDMSCFCKTCLPTSSE